MKFYSSAGAPLDKELGEFFHAVGIKILELLKNDGPATQGKIADELDLKQTTVSYNIRKLVEEGKIEGSGEERGTTFRVVDELG